MGEDKICKTMLEIEDFYSILNFRFLIKGVE